MKTAAFFVLFSLPAGLVFAGDVVIVKPPGAGEVVIVKPPAKVTVINPESGKRYTVNVREPEEGIDLSGAWAGYARVERDGKEKELSVTVNIRYEGSDLFATMLLEDGSGDRRVTEAECSDNGGGLFKLNETYIKTSTGWFEGMEIRGYEFDYTGRAGKQPDRMVERGGDFFNYGSYVMVLSRRTSDKKEK